MSGEKINADTIYKRLRENRVMLSNNYIYNYRYIYNLYIIKTIVFYKYNILRILNLNTYIFVY